VTILLGRGEPGQPPRPGEDEDQTCPETGHGQRIQRGLVEHERRRQPERGMVGHGVELTPEATVRRRPAGQRAVDGIEDRGDRDGDQRADQAAPGREHEGDERGREAARGHQVGGADLRSHASAPT